MGVDPRGLWQFTLSGGDGFGGSLTFGYNSGQWNFGLWGGLGEGFSWELNPRDSGCHETGFSPSLNIGADVRLGYAQGGSLGGKLSYGGGGLSLDADISAGLGLGANGNGGVTVTGAGFGDGHIGPTVGGGSSAVGAVGGQGYW